MTYFMFFIFIWNSFGFISKNNLTITIDDCKSDQGKIMIALYNSAETYMKEAKAVNKKIISIQNKKAVIVFENLPIGTYAFVFFHDENGNQKLDTNFMGIPREGYGFSNNAKGTFGAPSFSKSGFKLEKNYTTSVKLNY